ncbi:MAG: TerB N-terminal domain-containing protein [Roseivirga sp.]|nr:TerB N-terminal domain-containing protein [Roseivirga sp.]
MNFRSDTDYIHSYSYFEKEKSKNTSKGKWIMPGEEVSIKSKTISKGLFYFGGVLKGENYNETESSLVDETLQIKESQYTYTDSSLGYWPSFIDLSPSCRGAYIDWLASDRDMSDTPIGYLFIYFYGLERRIIKDYKDGLVGDEECLQICNEIIRLRSVFRDNYSFNSYSSNLLEYISITLPHILSIQDDQIENSINSNVFKVKLARIAQNSEPLNPELAFSWISNHPEHSFRTPARRCPEEFRTLFLYRYKETYNDGIVIKPNKTKLNLHYRPASRSLSYFRYGPHDLSDVTVLSGPTNKLAKIAYQCVDDLDAYSRYLGRKNSNKESIEAVALLPNELINEFQLIKDLRLWAENIITTNDGICEFKDFWRQTKLPLPSKLNKKEQELACNLIEKIGYSAAPDLNLHSSKLNIDDPIVIYHRHEPIEFKKQKVFRDVAIKLRLGSIIANADLHIHSNEKTYLQELINTNDNLSSEEKLSLEAYLKWLLISPSDFSGLKNSLSKLSEHNKELVRKMIIHVALSDGKIDPNEVKEIEKLYTSLGFDKSAVPADIHALSSRKVEHVSTRKDAVPKTNQNKSFSLDESVLSFHETETKQAQDILNNIFKNEDEEEEMIQAIPEQTLENKALSIYQIISHRDRIEKDEFERICSEYGFFVQSAIDSINEWAFEKVNAPVLEEDVDVIVDREIAEELKEYEET